jgi:hypothetical protein
MGAAGEPTGRPKRRQGGLARDGLPPGARSRGWFAYYHLHNNQKIVVSVTADAVTINKRPGDVYAFSDARFGRWAYGDRLSVTPEMIVCLPGMEELTIAVVTGPETRRSNSVSRGAARSSNGSTTPPTLRYQRRTGWCLSRSSA